MTIYSNKFARNNVGCFISNVAGAIGGCYLGCKLGTKHGFLGKLAGSAIGLWSGRKIAAGVSRAVQYSAQALHWAYMTAKEG